MGYSVPKKPLDLKEFLSEPAKTTVRRQFGYRQSKPAPSNTTGTGDAAKSSGSEDDPQR